MVLSGTKAQGSFYWREFLVYHCLVFTGLVHYFFYGVTFSTSNLQTDERLLCFIGLITSIGFDFWLIDLAFSVDR